MVQKLLVLVLVMLASACASMDMKPPSDADIKAESCRIDPYQDKCQPGAPQH